MTDLVQAKNPKTYEYNLIEKHSGKTKAHKLTKYKGVPIVSWDLYKEIKIMPIIATVVTAKICFSENLKEDILK